MNIQWGQVFHYSQLINWSTAFSTSQLVDDNAALALPWNQEKKTYRNKLLMYCKGK